MYLQKYNLFVVFLYPLFFEFLLGGAVLWVDVAVVTVVFSDIVCIYLVLQGFVEVFCNQGN